MKEILLGIAVSIQTLRGCIAQELKLPQYDTQPPTNELLKHARAYTWKAYYKEFKHNVFRFDPNMNKKTKKSFCKNFKRITKTETGKTLLCRILIEIRKRQSTQQTDAKLFIKEDRGMCFSQDDEHSLANLMYSIDLINACVIDPAQYTSGANHILLSPDIEDNRHIHLFHELCHWFHSLQDFERVQKERCMPGRIFDHNLSYYYFHDANPITSEEIEENDRLAKAASESMLWGNKVTLKVEEIRTILGAPKDVYYQEGDDLCENLYRMELGLPLRFGHLAYGSMRMNATNYQADIKIMKRVINTCMANYMEYQ